jgi:hypothetical protein
MERTSDPNFSARRLLLLLTDRSPSPERVMPNVLAGYESTKSRAQPIGTPKGQPRSISMARSVLYVPSAKYQVGPTCRGRCAAAQACCAAPAGSGAD